MGYVSFLQRHYLHILNESPKKVFYCLNKSVVQSFYYLKAVTSSIPLVWPNTSVVQMYEFAILIWATKQNEFVFIYILRILVFGNTFYIFFCVWLIFDLTPLETVAWYICCLWFTLYSLLYHESSMQTFNSVCCWHKSSLQVI